MSMPRIDWESEACDRMFDPVSGAKLTQLTSSAMLSLLIYCEQPYCSPDGHRLAILRRAEAATRQPSKLLVADLRTLYVIEIDTGVIGVFNAAWSGLIWYYTTDRQLKRLTLTTLAVEKIDVPFDPDLVGRSASVSPDQRYIICRTELTAGKTPSIGIKRLDLHTMKSEVIYDHPEMVNPHIQFNPIHGRDILVQLNRGSKLKSDGTQEKWGDIEKGVTHFLIDKDGGNYRSLPIGPPYSASSTGHSAHVADTGKVIVSTSWNAETFALDPRTPDGNLIIAAAGESKPQVFRTPELRPYHVCASRCGKYVVADFVDGPLWDENRRIRTYGIVVGNLISGKYRRLVDNVGSGNGGGEHNHVHPYITADNRHVIYQANPNFTPTQVWAAQIPDGFLESLN